MFFKTLLAIWLTFAACFAGVCIAIALVGTTPDLSQRAGAAFLSSLLVMPCVLLDVWRGGREA